jgi:O-antigen/teichoic acid export membrane protein
MILRNSVLSLGSLAIPLLVGLFTVPKILHELGLERFGVLTLVWAVVGFSSLLDFGVSRALTKRVAELHRQSTRLRSLIRTGLYFIALLALGMGLLALSMTDLFDFERFKLSHDEFENSSFLLALSISVVILGGGFRGVLEGLQRFGVVSFVRLGFGLITFIAPLLILESAPRIDCIIAIMLVARTVGTLIMAWSCRAYLSKGRRSHARRWIELRQLMVTGGWMTLSNLASALMLYVDRFFIAGSAFAPTLALYTTPYEFVTKLFIIPSALSSVLFPQMACTARSTSTESKLLATGSAAILAVVTPMIAAVMLFAPEVLGWWLSPEFGQDASFALRVLSIGVLVNCLAQIFQTYLLGYGCAAWIAWMHCLEVCIFLPVYYVAIQHFGLVGAAWTWTARIFFDSLAMALMLGSVARSSRHHWWSLLASAVLACVLFSCSSLGTYSKCVLLSVLSVSCACFGFWCFRHYQIPSIPNKSSISKSIRRSPQT